MVFVLAVMSSKKGVEFSSLQQQLRAAVERVRREPAGAAAVPPLSPATPPRPEVIVIESDLYRTGMGIGPCGSSQIDRGC